MAMMFCKKISRVATGAFALTVATGGAVAADWKPEKTVELVVGSAAGGPLDTTARLVQGYADLRKIGVPVIVQSRTGGAQAIAMSYVSQHAGDGHYLAMVLPNLLTNRITGRAGGQHLAAGMIMSAAGVDLKKVRFVSFKGGAEAVPAVLGGHVDVLMATPTTAWRHVQGGQLRMLAIAAPQRYAGERAAIPTWKELGINAVMGNWRGVAGAKGLTPAQVAYWDAFFFGLVKSAEWQEALAKYQWDSFHLNAADTVKFLQEESRILASLLRELGDAK